MAAADNKAFGCLRFEPVPDGGTVRVLDENGTCLGEFDYRTSLGLAPFPRMFGIADAPAQVEQYDAAFAAISEDAANLLAAGSLPSKARERLRHILEISRQRRSLSRDEVRRAGAR